MSLEDPLFSREDIQSAYAYFGDLGVTIGGLSAESLSVPFTPQSIEDVGKALKAVSAESNLPAHHSKLIVYIALRAATLMTEAHGPVVALVAKQPTQIIRHALNILFHEEGMILETMKLLDRGGAKADDLRRLAYGAVKARPNEFWFTFHYIKNVNDINRKLSLIEGLCARFPNSLASIGMLFATVSVAPNQVTKLQTTLRTIAATYGDRLTGWGFVVFARTARNHLPLAEALKLFDHFDHRAESKEVWEQALLEKGQILLALARTDMNYVRLAISAMLTFAVINPVHVRASECIENAIELLSDEDEANVSHDLECLISENVPILVNGTDIDVAYSTISSYLDHDWINSERLKAFLACPSYLQVERTPLARNERIVIKGVNFWDKYNNDLPERYATSTGDINLERRAQFQYDVENVFLYNDSRLNLVQSFDGRVIRPASQGYANFFSGLVPPSVNRDYEDGRALGLVMGYGDDNYCHFLYDRAPMLEYVLRRGDLPDFIVTEEILVGWCRQLIGMLGLNLEVRPIRNKVSYSFKHLRLFTSTMHPGHFWPEEHKAFFKRFHSEPKPQTRRIFIKRPKGRRGLANESEIHAIALSKGFEILELEKMTMAQQRDAFAEAEFIAGPHGAGFSNMVFCQRGTKVLELARKGYMTASYSITAGCFEMPYAILLDEGPERGRSDGRIKFEDLEIDPKKFAAMIDDMAAL